MPELIDRQAALRLCIEGSGLYDEGFTEGYNFAVSEIRGKLKTLPTIEPEVRHGQWITHFNAYGLNIKECSKCGHYRSVGSDGNFCANCGAKMGNSEVETDTVARWEDAGILGTVKCSRCNFVDYFAKQDRVMLFGFCPGCGAKMKED